MNVFKMLFVGLFVSLFVISCDIEEDVVSSEFVINGVIEKQDTSLILPGTHRIQDFNIESSLFNLDDFENQNITVFANRIEMDPEHLEVIDIKN